MRVSFFMSILFLLNAFLSFSQEVIHWTAETQEEEIIITAEIEEGWHLYSQYVDESIGPVATSFEFSTSNKTEFIGDVLEPKSIEKYDENFEGTLSFFEQNVQFVQKIHQNGADIIECVVTFMVCNDTMCLPPEDYKILIEIE